MEQGVERRRWSQQGNGQGMCGWGEAAVTGVRSSWGQDGGRGGGSVPSLLINLPVIQAPSGLVCKKSACNSGAAGDVVRSLDQEDPLEDPRFLLEVFVLKLGTFDATPKVPRHPSFTRGEHRGSRHHFI